MPIRAGSRSAFALLVVFTLAASGVGSRQASEAPTSAVLIDRALAAGTINAETAHKYRMFAAFGDSRLPAAYRGASTGFRALIPLMAEVGGLLASFAPATRADLEPFFTRPDAPDSWITLSTAPGQELEDSGGGESTPGDADVAVFGNSGRRDTAAPAAVTWQSVMAAGGKAKVWWQDRYPNDAPKAQGLARELTSKIWPRLTGVMRQEPLPDNGILRNGGDPALDFYLVRPVNVEWAGLAASTIPDLGCHAGRYLLIDSRHVLGDDRTYGLLQIATHELMHAITFGFQVRNGCPETWIGEASGDWASNWLYPLTDDEHQLAFEYTKTVEYSLNNPKSPSGDKRFYGEHLLPLFLEKVTGGTGFMPRMWTNFKTMAAYEGINAVMPGGFERTWPRFLVRLWDRAPVDTPNGFKEWDRIPLGPSPTGGQDTIKISTSGIETRSITFKQENLAELLLATGVQPAAGHYRNYIFDRSVRSVTFRNTIREEGILHGTVWGIEKIGGQWQQPVDWTAELRKDWCRDEPKEDIEELVIVFGNHDWKTQQTVNPREAPTVEARGTGCSGWTGTASVVTTIVSRDPAIRIVENISSNIQFGIDSSLVLLGQPREYWKSVGGSIGWRVDVTGSCRGSGSGTITIPDRQDDHAATLRVWSEDGRMHHSGTGSWPVAVPTYTLVCPKESSDMPLFSALGFFVTDFENDALSPDGKSFSGRHTSNPSPESTATHVYAFKCTRGC